MCECLQRIQDGHASNGSSQKNFLGKYTWEENMGVASDSFGLQNLMPAVAPCQLAQPEMATAFLPPGPVQY